MRIVLVACLAFGLSACDSPNFRTSQFRFGDAETLAATGSLRFVTERQRPSDPPDQRVICTEPSPDYAAALNSRVTVAVSGVPAGTGTAGGSADASAVEQISRGDGRSAGVLALRDGLYAACQDYANGIIGKDAYSIILSQYGGLLVAVSNGGSPTDPAGPGRRTTPVPTGGAFAAMLVACISAYDPTRPADDRSGGRVPPNRLLDARICSQVLHNAARRA